MTLMSFIAMLTTPAIQRVPFVHSLPVWDYWPLLLLPLCLAVSIVYKSVKCASMRTVPREALVIFAWILIFMVIGGAALSGVVTIATRL